MTKKQIALALKYIEEDSKNFENLNNLLFLAIAYNEAIGNLKDLLDDMKNQL